MVLPVELGAAAIGGNTAAIQEWLSTGTRDPDEDDGYRGETLLYKAASRGHIEMIRVILAHGASVNASNTYGMTSLHLAARDGYYATAALLLDRGAQVDARTFLNLTPLNIVIGGKDCSCEMIRLLLHHGADLDGRNAHGRNAETNARDWNKTEAAALLADVRRAGGWRGYVRYPRFRLLMLRIVAEQGRAETQDPLLRRLFPAGPPASGGTKRPREAYRAQKGGRLPRGIFAHIVGFWRSSRDYRAPASGGASPPNPARVF